MYNTARTSFAASLFLSTALCLSLASQAQAADAVVAPATVSEVIVTGSALPTTLDAVAVPVSTINSVSIAKGGVTSDVLEILRKNIPAFAGRSNAGASNANNTNQNTAGGSQVQLRNLDTLVLVNGRRSAIDAIAGIGGKTFVNVSAIPPSAIDRIEVLEDGSSAIYGSDAVGGVVNLILKSHYTGAEVGGRYGTADGDYAERSAYFIIGGDVLKGVNLTVTGSTSHNDPLYQNRRAFSSPFFVSSGTIPGTIGLEILSPVLNTPSANNPTGTAATAANFASLTPGTYSLAPNAAAIGRTYDLSQFQTLLLRQNQDAVAANFNADLTESGGVVAFGGVEYAHNKSFTQFLPRVTTVTVPKGAPFNPFTTAISGVNFGDTAKPKQYFNDDESVRATIGLKGEFGALGRTWKWETAYVHSQDTLQQDITNLIYKPNLALAIAGGYDSVGNPVAGGAYSKVFGNFSNAGTPSVLQPALDPFARAAGLNPASLVNLYGTEVVNAKSVLETADAKLTGNLFTLPGGDVGIAVGASWRKESLSAHTDPNGNNTGPTAQLWIGGQFNDAFAKSRTIDAVFTEVRVPVTSPSWNTPGLYALDLIGALRYEHYSDAGSSTVPKIGFRWQPLDTQFTVRGTFSKSFTAPSLFAEYGPTDTRIAGGAIIPSTFPSITVQAPFQAEDGNNPSLKPAKATSYFLGFVVKPDAIPGLVVSVDYSQVHEAGIAGGIGFANILTDVNNKGSASPFYNNLSKNNFVGLPGAVQFSNPGDVLAYLQAAPVANANNLYAIDRFTNLGGVKVRSFNVNAAYQWKTNNFGVFTLDATAAIFASYKFQALPSQKFYEYAGTSTNGGTGVQGTLPKFRSYTTLDWRIGDWDLTLGNTYISSVKDLGAGGITYETNHALHPATTFPVHVNSYTTWDIRAAYDFNASALPLLKSWTVAAGVNNIANTMPPLSPKAFTDNHADVATYSPIGRLIYVSARAKF